MYSSSEEIQFTCTKTMLETKSYEISQDNQEIKFHTVLPLQAETAHAGGDLCMGS